VHLRGGLNQEKHFEPLLRSLKINTRHSDRRADRARLRQAQISRADLCRRSFGLQQGEVFMSGQVVLYFEDQADALRFALAAGSVMAGEGAKFTDDLVEETTRVTRIRIDAVNAGKKANPPERAA
jgi:hypothetical protein